MLRMSEEIHQEVAERQSATFPDFGTPIFWPAGSPFVTQQYSRKRIVQIALEFITISYYTLYYPKHHV